ncbi:hypothetical protein FNW02_22845 [Komarekiella sp. 'clone 1']|uniref:Uncharacterized protein n=1 Tax=Komarekiella delphini-convector SJRDD-AB1 TaxID=2593771 RepID=A0AA40VT12_9NOST|nr:hypothetical protein [Komarekiella delphini-convector]MBD6618587.1 hypothetical protein [Komarekiella delphini-convector SJRDD-AB1]
MSVKLKLFWILILSIFATAGAGLYLTQHQLSPPIFETSSGQSQQMEAVPQSQEVVAYSERSDYKTIPLESINSGLQGSDPATLALNAFDDIASARGTRKVEVVYPQRNHASVTITQIKQSDDSVGAIKYRVEMTTFGRSLFISSPPVWQIVWAGSQIQCLPGSRAHKKVTQSCN